jgi:hypothetical protein
LRLTLTGYRGVHLDMDVHALSSEVLGGQDAISRYLGERLKDAVQVKSSVVVAEGTLRTSSFASEGESYDLHDGMVGVVDVELDSRSVLATIMPGLAQ